MTLYSRLVRPLAFRLDAEWAHRIAIGAARRSGWAAPVMRTVCPKPDRRLEIDVAGLRLANPIGLAAGFDENGTGIAGLACLGLGAIEIGSVSLDPSHGNPPPRLFRLPEDEAIVVHYGLPNDGARVIATRLGKARHGCPLGINIVNTNRGQGAPPESRDQIIGEYVEAARILAPHADYLMFNLSCPNTADGRDFFADRGHLDACLSALAGIGLAIPAFLKVSPVGGIGRRRSPWLRLRLHVQPAARQAGQSDDGAGYLEVDAGRGLGPTLRGAGELLHPRNLPAQGPQAPRRHRGGRRVRCPRAHTRRSASVPRWCKC